MAFLLGDFARNRQTFRNDGPEWVEGVYVFPLPATAAVDRLRMHIGERFIEGEIREKAQAQKEYAAAKTAGKKTSLVEQQRANLFTTSVANIGPGETISVEIEYLETISYDEGSFSIRFPLTLTPRYIPGTPQWLGARYDQRAGCVIDYAAGRYALAGSQAEVRGDDQCRCAAGADRQSLSSRRCQR